MSAANSLRTGALARVQAPTLLIVGGHDQVVLELDQAAQEEMSCETMLTVVPGSIRRDR